MFELNSRVRKDLRMVKAALDLSQLDGAAPVFSIDVSDSLSTLPIVAASNAALPTVGKFQSKGGSFDGGGKVAGQLSNSMTTVSLQESFTAKTQ